jgi:sphingomyelin phosphodiesterase
MKLTTLVAAVASLATIHGAAGENWVNTIWDEIKQTITCAGCEVCSQLKALRNQDSD